MNSSTSGDSLAYNNIWNDENKKIIRDNYNYFKNMVDVTRDLARAGPVGISLPKKPKASIDNLLTKRSSKQKKLVGIELHRYLITKLNTVDRCPLCPVVNNSINLSLDMVKCHLQIGYAAVKFTNSQAIGGYLGYGEWLNLAFELHKAAKVSGKITNTWSDWLQSNVGISLSYSRQLRDISKLFKDYPKIKKLGISFSELYSKRHDICGMFILNKKIADYWKQIN